MFAPYQVDTFLIGLFVSVLTVLFILPLGGFLKKLHNDAHNLAWAPRLGGVACFLGVAEFLILFSNHLSHTVIVCLLFAGVMGIIGTIDDLCFKIKAKIKLFLSLLIGALACFYQLSLVRDLTHSEPALGANLFIVLSLMTIWVSLSTQAFNIIDGANGLLAVNFITPLAVIIYFLTITTSFDSIHYVVFFCGFSIGMLAFNVFFAKFYHGDGGAYFLGALLGTSGLTLLLHSDEVRWGALPVLAFLPIYELLRSAFRRLISSHGIFTPDNGHLHSYILQRSLKGGSRLGYLHPCIVLSVFPIFSGLAVLFFGDNALALFGVTFFLIALYELLMLSFKRDKSDKHVTL